MTFDPTKPCTTRDGREVRLFTERMKDGRLAGVRVDRNGNEWLTSWYPNGVNIACEERDLINIPKKHHLWLNVYEHEKGNYYVHIHQTEESARSVDGPGIKGRVKVEFEEGEGL